MATNPQTQGNGIMVIIPSYGANIIQAGQGFPVTVMQPPGMGQYPGQPFGVSSSQPQQSHQLGPLEKLLKVETKTLGAIQIMIGFIHIGFGTVAYFLWEQYYMSLTTTGGYPLWGGVFFIVSGSLSVASVKRFNSSLMKCSVGMNITSAVMSLTGICLYLAQLAINPPYVHQVDDIAYISRLVGTGISVLLLLFSSLEFCITVSTAHFGCQATCYNNQMAMVYLPYTVIQNDAATPAQGNFSPPSYDSVDMSQNRDA